MQGQPMRKAMLSAEQQLIRQGQITNSHHVQKNTVDTSRKKSSHDYNKPGEYLAYPQGGGQVLIVDAIYGEEIMVLQSTGDGNYINSRVDRLLPE